jgi:hypothetical protein
MIFQNGRFFLTGLLITLRILHSGPIEAKAWQQDSTSQVLERLLAFPGVRVETQKPYSHFTEVYTILFIQPLDHNNPDSGYFQQRIQLSHVDVSRPVVLITEGYDMRERSNPVQELSEFLNANQVRVEHRYFGKSKPDSMLWGYLTIRQAAADHHRVVNLFKTIYPGKWVSTGWSKGGQTALFHRRFYPDDVDVTVAYDAPLNFSDEDPRIDAFFETAGAPYCRDRLIRFQRTVLQKKDEILPLFRDYANEKHLAFSIGEIRALEYIVLEYPFSFWQYHTIDCDSIPDDGAGIQEVFAHLKKVVSFSSYSDNAMNSQAMYQFSTELGYYGYVKKNVQDLLGSADYPNSVFAPQVDGLKYRPEAMQDIGEWLRKNGEHILYIYAERDPWSAPAVEVPEGMDAMKMILKGGNHFTFIKTFPGDEQEVIFSTLERWLEI